MTFQGDILDTGVCHMAFFERPRRQRADAPPPLRPADDRRRGLRRAAGPRRRGSRRARRPDRGRVRRVHLQLDAGRRRAPASRASASPSERRAEAASPPALVDDEVLHEAARPADHGADEAVVVRREQHEAGVELGVALKRRLPRSSGLDAAAAVAVGVDEQGVERRRVRGLVRPHRDAGGPRRRRRRRREVDAHAQDGRRDGFTGHGAHDTRAWDAPAVAVGRRSAIVATSPSRTGSGTRPARRPRRVSPASEEEVQAAVRAAVAAARASASSRRSFAPVHLTDGTLTTTSRTSTHPSIDTGRPSRRDAAGDDRRRAGDPLWEAGLALPNQGDIDTQGIAGASAPRPTAPASASGEHRASLALPARDRYRRGRRDRRSAATSLRAAQVAVGITTRSCSAATARRRWSPSATRSCSARAASSSW